MKEESDCTTYLRSLELPTPAEILDGLLGHAIFNFNMSGAGVLTDLSEIPQFLNDCDQHQVVHLTQFSDCLAAVAMVVDQPTHVVQAKFHKMRDRLDDKFVASQVGDKSFEEVFFGAQEGSKEDDSKEDSNPEG
jgi:hypothetical protein